MWRNLSELLCLAYNGDKTLHVGDALVSGILYNIVLYDMYKNIPVNITLFLDANIKLSWKSMYFSASIDEMKDVN